MKFGALLRTSAGEVPELQELFAAYKQLKKHLKRLPEKEALQGGSATISPAAAEALGATEADFVAALSRDVARFNDMFLEREEDAVIRLRSLEDLASLPQSGNHLKDVYRKFVDFHGEMLLLVHWSILAYTGIVKILKKHHKRTGLLVKAPHLDNLAGQPFCSTEPMSDLVRKAEADIDALRIQLSAVGSPLDHGAEQNTGPSHSAALLQAAQHGGEGPTLTFPPIAVTALTARHLMAAASDSGSAPSAASDGASNRASNDDTRSSDGSQLSPRDRATAAPGSSVHSKGCAVSSVRAGVKRSKPEAATGSEGAVSSPRRRVHMGSATEQLPQRGIPGQQLLHQQPRPLANRRRNAVSACREPHGSCMEPHGSCVEAQPSSAAAAAAVTGNVAVCSGTESAAASAPDGDTRGAGSSGSDDVGIVMQGRCLLEMHLVHHEELQRQQVEREGALEQAGSVAGGSHSSRLGGSPSSLPTGDGPPTMLRPSVRTAAIVRQLSDASSDRGDHITCDSPLVLGRSVAAANDFPQHQPPHQQARGQHDPAVPSGSGLRILAQTQAALGLWKELTETASTPSTVLPLSHHLAGGHRQHPASSIATDHSAA